MGYKLYLEIFFFQEHSLKEHSQQHIHVWCWIFAVIGRSTVWQETSGSGPSGEPDLCSGPKLGRHKLVGRENE